MALISCKKCGQSVSDKAKICPHCGETLFDEFEKIEEARMCEECGQALSEGADLCPNCGCPIDVKTDETEEKANSPENVNKKRWMLPVLIVVVVIAVVWFMISSGNQDQPSQDAGSTNTEAEAADKTEDKDSKETGPVATYKLIEENTADSDMKFTMNEDAIAFITEHPDFFPGSSKNEGAMNDYVDYEVDYQHIAKSSSKYSNLLIAIEGVVIDCEEIDSGDQTITFLQIADNNGNDYCLYYLGALKNVFEDEEVWGYALPFGMVTFENMGGSYTEAVIGAATYIYTYADALDMEE